MAGDRLQQQRLELKYQITESVAERIRDFISCYLEVDEFGLTRPGYAYPVHSLYLDSDTMQTYWETINGNKNRFKLRLRYYDDRPDSPVFFEIKRRMNNCILKQRGGVKRSAVASLLAGHLPDPSHLTSQEPKHLVAIQRFCEKMMLLRATPKAHISYEREAWVSPHDNSIRITFDRNVRCERDFTSLLPVESGVTGIPSYPFKPLLVLEIKFTVRGQRRKLWDWPEDVVMDTKNQIYPPWFEDLVRTFGLTQTGAAKYVDGVTVCGEHLFSGSEDSFVAFDRQTECEIDMKERLQEEKKVEIKEVEPVQEATC